VDCWKGHSDIGHAVVRGIATWCMQLGRAWQYGACGCERGGNMAHAARRGAVMWRVWPRGAGQARAPTLQEYSKVSWIKAMKLLT